MAVKMSGRLKNVKIEGATRVKAVGVVSTVQDNGAGMQLVADGTKTLAQLVQDHAAFVEVETAVPDSEVSSERGLAHVPPAGTVVDFLVALHVSATDPAV